MAGRQGGGPGVGRGQERAIAWQKLGDTLVPNRIATGAEVLTATWQKLDRASLVPVDFKFERVFGRDVERFAPIATYDLDNNRYIAMKTDDIPGKVPKLG